MSLASWFLAITGPVAMLPAQSREIAALNFAALSVGQLPAGVQVIRGSLDVVTKDGMPMLRATAPSAFVLALDEQLPQDFTVEFDLIPKNCCNPEDLSFEGTSTLSESAASAHLLWHPNSQVVLGGGSAYQNPVPASLRDALPGRLTRIVVTFEGTTVRMYTNERRLYTLTDRRFVRGRVLRVFLGGQDAGDNAVHLARMRVVAGVQPPVAPTPVVLAGGQPTGTITPTAPPAAPPIVTAPVAGQVGSVTRTAPPSPAPGPPSGPPPGPPPGAPPAAPPAGSTLLPPRTIDMPGFTAIGSYVAYASRTIDMPGFTGVGLFATYAARTIDMPGFAATGLFVTYAARTIDMPGFAAAGLFATYAARTIDMPGFTAAGLFATYPPRTIDMPGFTASGTFVSFASRTITMPGWTAVGVFP